MKITYFLACLAISVFCAIGASVAAENPSQFRVDHYGLRFRINPATKVLKGSVAITLEPAQTPPSTEIKLDLNDSMTVTGVKVNDKVLPFSRSKDNLIVQLTS